MTSGPAGLSRASRQLPCQRPQSTPMAGSGCSWGAEPPRFLEAFGRLWQVQSRLGSGSSASVYRVRCCGTPGSPPGALKQFLPPGTTGAAASAAEYGFRKERAALEQLQGHRNIGNSRRLVSPRPGPSPSVHSLSAWRSFFRPLAGEVALAFSLSPCLGPLPIPLSPFYCLQYGGGGGLLCPVSHSRCSVSSFCFRSALENVTPVSIENYLL